jgi:hypothetical protein
VYSYYFFGVGDYTESCVVTRATINVDIVKDEGATKVCACRIERGLFRLHEVYSS